jgi:hypothetical protein
MVVYACGAMPSVSPAIFGSCYVLTRKPFTTAFHDEGVRIVSVRLSCDKSSLYIELGPLSATRTREIAEDVMPDFREAGSLSVTTRSTPLEIMI